MTLKSQFFNLQFLIKYNNKMRKSEQQHQTTQQDKLIPVSNVQRPEDFIRLSDLIISLAIIAGILLGLHYIIIIGKFHVALGKLKEMGKYEEALDLYQQLKQIPLSDQIYLEDKIQLLALLQQWQLLKQEADKGVNGFYSKSFSMWYYKGLAEFLLDLDEQCQISLTESNYLKDTSESKTLLRGLFRNSKRAKLEFV